MVSDIINLIDELIYRSFQKGKLQSKLFACYEMAKRFEIAVAGILIKFDEIKKDCNAVFSQ